MKKLSSLLLVVFLAFVSGCGSSAPSEVTVNISLKDGKVTPSGEAVSVAKGGKVTLVVETDKEDIIHVHGHGIEREVKPGETTTIEFTADKVGRWEIESHSPALLIVKLSVT